MISDCTISGPLTALPNMSANAICERFESELARALGDTPAPDGLVIALTLHKRGAVDAQLSVPDTEPGANLPRVSVDAIDRALRTEDLSRLADAAAQVLTRRQSLKTSRPTA